MKATGIVRRVDELGRIVIPKELRRVLRIREGDEMEIYTKEGNELVLKRYSTLGSLKEHAVEYADAVYESLKKTVLITDTSEVIAAAGKEKGGYIGKRLSHSMVEQLMRREEKDFSGDDMLRVVPDDTMTACSQLILPIISGGDVYGSLIILSEESSISVVEKKVAENAIAFLRLSVPQ